MRELMSGYLSAEDAAAELGVSVQTLYAYVSRGLIRSEATGGKRRTHRYSAEDVARLKARKAGRRDPAKAVEGALDFGEPLLESGITLITNGRLYYRGHDVLALAQSETIERVAALLWTGALDTPIDWHTAPPDTDARAMLDRLTPFERFGVLVSLVGALDPGAYDLRPEAVVQVGARIINLLAGTAVTDDLPGQTIATRLAQGWDVADHAALIDVALILCADHELNVSTFAARCAASAGGTVYNAVSAGLAALQGVRHGGQTRRVEAFVREMLAAPDLDAALLDRLKRGEAVPGFGHRLYPAGDPRGRLLLDLLDEIGTDNPINALEAAAARLTGAAPTIDFALVALAQRLDLPPSTPLTLFALGRSVGWIGHTLEQIAADRLIRPRARYTGPQPPLTEP
jgi:citrate synthase